MIEINFKGRRVRIRSSEARQLECEDNIQIISRKNNQTGGKGGQTQKEWSTDQEEMEMK